MSTHETLLALFQCRSASLARHRLLARGITPSESLLSEVEEFESLTVEEFTQSIESRMVDCDRTRLFAARFLMHAPQGRRPGYELGASLKRLADLHADNELRALGEVVSARDALVRREFATAIPQLEAIARETSLDDANPFTAYLLATAHHWLGWGYRQSGDFNAANRALRHAVKVAESSDLCVQWSYRATLGALIVATGQFRKALQYLNDEQLRNASREQNDVETLAYIHTLSAEAALSLQVAAKANCEIGDLQDLVEANEERLGHNRGYLILLSAKLDSLWGNRDEAIHLFKYAIELFEALSPPNYTAVIDAKLELAKFAASDRRYPIAFQAIRELLEEAEARGCMEARTRLLAFQAKLALCDDAPSAELRDAYDNLVARVHLMNNPRLTFIAYADLYSYARKHLDRTEQAFWLARLKGLQGLLDRSCYADLYESYVTERYREEIEGDLRDLGWGPEEG